MGWKVGGVIFFRIDFGGYVLADIEGLKDWRTGWRMDERMGWRMDERMGWRMDERMGWRMDERMGWRMDERMGWRLDKRLKDAELDAVGWVGRWIRGWVVG